MTKEKIKDAIYTRRYIYNFHYHLIWVTKYRNQTFRECQECCVKKETSPA